MGDFSPIIILPNYKVFDFMIKYKISLKGGILCQGQESLEEFAVYQR